MSNDDTKQKKPADSKTSRGAFRLPSNGSKRRGVKKKRSKLPIVAIALIAIALGGTSYFLFAGHHATTPSGSSSPAKWEILYVNQGNAFVGENNFSELLSTAKSHGFTTVFFEVYKSGTLLYSSDELKYFVVTSHAQNVSIFFALYFTDPSQQLPTSIYALGEDGISLDLSAIPPTDQQVLLSKLQSGYSEGKTAVTTTDFSTTLKPGLLILETYDFQNDKQYVHPGIVAGVEVATTTSRAEYESEVQYALGNSDGVMVFDYYGLALRGY